MVWGWALPMDHANDNEPAAVERYRGNYPLLALALLISCAVWFVLGLTIWRALSGLAQHHP
jgi:hypothetical protein